MSIKINPSVQFAQTLYTQAQDLGRKEENFGLSSVEGKSLAERIVRIPGDPGQVHQVGQIRNELKTSLESWGLSDETKTQIANKLGIGNDTNANKALSNREVIDVVNTARSDRTLSETMIRKAISVVKLPQEITNALMETIKEHPDHPDVIQFLNSYLNNDTAHGDLDAFCRVAALAAERQADVHSPVSAYLRGLSDSQKPTQTLEEFKKQKEGGEVVGQQEHVNSEDNVPEIQQQSADKEIAKVPERDNGSPKAEKLKSKTQQLKSSDFEQLKELMPKNETDALRPAEKGPEEPQKMSEGDGLAVIRQQRVHNTAQKQPDAWIDSLSYDGINDLLVADEHKCGLDDRFVLAGLEPDERMKQKFVETLQKHLRNLPDLRNLKPDSVEGRNQIATEAKKLVMGMAYHLRMGRWFDKEASELVPKDVHNGSNVQMSRKELLDAIRAHVTSVNTPIYAEFEKQFTEALSHKDGSKTRWVSLAAMQRQATADIKDYLETQLGLDNDHEEKAVDLDQWRTELFTELATQRTQIPPQHITAFMDVLENHVKASQERIGKFTGEEVRKTGEKMLNGWMTSVSRYLAGEGEESGKIRELILESLKSEATLQENCIKIMSVLTGPEMVTATHVLQALERKQSENPAKVEA